MNIFKGFTEKPIYRLNANKYCEAKILAKAMAPLQPFPKLPLSLCVSVKDVSSFVFWIRLKYSLMFNFLL